MSNNILDFGKNKGHQISECDTKYLKWLVSHEKVLAVRNRWASRDAAFELARRAQAAAQAAVVETLEELEARHEVEMAVKIAEHLVATPPRVDLGLKGHLSNNQGFRLMR
jgi:hypothetical protein